MTKSLEESVKETCEWELTCLVGGEEMLNQMHEDWLKYKASQVYINEEALWQKWIRL